jgi:hypothetical protein
MNGQITITVSKTALLKVLSDNRGSHHDLYEKAWTGYCKAVRAELEDMLDRVKAQKPIPRFLGNLPPEDHTADYDDVIDMLGMALGDEIELTQAQFKQYVKDDWGWKEQWTAHTSTYIQA